MTLKELKEMFVYLWMASSSLYIIGRICDYESFVAIGTAVMLPAAVLFLIFTIMDLRRK